MNICWAWQIAGVGQLMAALLSMASTANYTAEAARALRARAVFDSSNNSAFASILAARFASYSQDSQAALTRFSSFAPGKDHCASFSDFEPGFTDIARPSATVLDKVKRREAAMHLIFSEK